MESLDDESKINCLLLFVGLRIFSLTVTVGDFPTALIPPTKITSFFNFWLDEPFCCTDSFLTSPAGRSEDILFNKHLNSSFILTRSSSTTKCEAETIGVAEDSSTIVKENDSVRDTFALIINECSSKGLSKFLICITSSKVEGIVGLKAIWIVLEEKGWIIPFLPSTMVTKPDDIFPDFEKE